MADAVAAVYPGVSRISEVQKLLRGLADRVAVVWCVYMHSAAMWPIRGHYRCRTCGRSYLIDWAARHTANHV
jgi:hypothetical protein